MGNEGDFINYVATATTPCETVRVKNTTSFRWLGTFPVNKARTLKPSYTAFEFSLVGGHVIW